MSKQVMMAGLIAFLAIGAGADNKVVAQVGQVFRKVNLAQLKGILQNEGMPVVEGDENSVFTKFEGDSVRVVVLGAGESIAVVDVLRDEGNRDDFQAINAFNEEFSGSAVVYRSGKHKTVVMVARLDLSGGVTLERIVSFLSSSKQAHGMFQLSFQR